MPAHAQPLGPAAIDAELQRLARFARSLDSSIAIPGTRFRIGIDPIIGLVPGLGDWVGVGLSSWILYRGWRLGARRRTLTRMLGNVGLEASVGVIPVIGDAFDAWFRCNERNMRLLERDLGVHVQESRSDRSSSRDSKRLNGKG